MIQFYWPKNLWVRLCSSVHLFIFSNQYSIISVFTELFACHFFLYRKRSPLIQFQATTGWGVGVSVFRAFGTQRNQLTCLNLKRVICKSAKMYTTWPKPRDLKWRVLRSIYPKSLERIFQLGTWPYGEASRILASFSSHGSLSTAAEMSKQWHFVRD